MSRGARRDFSARCVPGGAARHCRAGSSSGGIQGLRFALETGLASGDGAGVGHDSHGEILLTPTTDNIIARTTPNQCVCPTGITIARGTIWTIDPQREHLRSVRTDSLRQGATIRLSRRMPLAITAYRHLLWVTVIGPVRNTSGGPSRGPGSIYWTNPQTGNVHGKLPVGTRPASVVAGLGRVWVVNANDATITRVRPLSSGRASADEPIAYTEPSTDLQVVDASVGRGRFWMIDQRLRFVVVLTPTATTPTAIPVGLKRGETLAAITSGPSGTYVAIAGPRPRICRVRDDLGVGPCR